MREIIEPIFKPSTGILAPDSTVVSYIQIDRYKYVVKNVFNALNGPPGKRMKSRSETY